MFRITAPYPLLQTTTILPSPEWGDSVTLLPETIIIHAMDGTVYTYNKPKSNRRRFQWQFKLTRHKAIELKKFFQVYGTHQMKVTDHTNNSYIGTLQLNPLEFEGAERAGDLPGSELMNVTITFEEV